VHHAERYQAYQAFVHPLEVRETKDVFKSNEENIP
jgi:hypothetical protein